VLSTIHAEKPEDFEPRFSDKTGGTELIWEPTDFSSEKAGKSVLRVGSPCILPYSLFHLSFNLFIFSFSSLCSMSFKKLSFRTPWLPFLLHMQSI